MVNITDVRHLLRATRSFTAWRHSMKLVLRYAADRLGGRHRARGCCWATRWRPSCSTA